MSGWNHRCCERCWFDGPGQLPDNDFRIPTQIVNEPLGRCCFCGGATITGIYRRADPTVMSCQDNHVSYDDC